MKSLPAIFLLIVIGAVCPARADLVVKQKLETLFSFKEGGPVKTINSDIIIKIQGDRARQDRTSATGQTRSLITNFETGEVLRFSKGNKDALLIPLNPTAIKEQRARARKETPKPKATGRKDKIGGFDTEIFETTAAGSTVKLWVATDFPKAQAINEQLSKVLFEKNDPVDYGLFDVPGMVIKSERSAARGKSTVTLVSATEEPVAETEFKLPEGYRTSTMSKLAPAGSKAAPPAPKAVPVPK